MKKINNIIIILSIIVEVIYFILLPTKELNNILLLIAYIPVILIPKIFNYIFRKSKIKIDYNLEFAYLIFLIIAFLLGSIMGFYSKIHWYDSFAHLLSGVFTAYVSTVILKWLNRYKEKDTVFNVIYMILVTLSVAVLWECCEFTIDNVLGTDTQKVLKTGVNDTMKDMICALSGSIVFTIYYIFNPKKK